MHKFFFISTILIVLFCGIAKGEHRHLSTVSSTLDDRLVTFVVTHNTNPIIGANVSLDKYGDILTDSLGTAIFEEVKAPDTLEYIVSANNYISIQKQIIIGENDITENVELKPLNTKSEVTFYVAIGETPVEKAVINFHTYGTMRTGDDGKATYTNIAAGVGLIYTVEVADYSKFEGAITVSGEDVYEEVIFAPPSYSLTFNVNLNNEAYEGAKITLEGYGVTYSNKYGLARFLNVYGENIPYNIETDKYGSVQSVISVIDSDATVSVEFTGIFDQQKPALEIFPNPTSYYFEINVKNKGICTIYSTNGRLITTMNVYHGKNLIHLNGLDAGIYIVNFTSKKEVLTNKLIVK